MRNFPDTIVSEYTNSTTLTQFIANFNEWVSPDYNLQQFYDLIWNALADYDLFIDTPSANYGLDVWGRIVGIGRVLTIAVTRYFGFEETADPAAVTGYNVAPFYSGQSITSNFTLTNRAYRLLILAKAAANICDGSIPQINQILLNLFPDRGHCYVVDNMDMTMVYTFDFHLEPFEAAIVQNSGVLPTPAGVLATVSFLP